MVYIFNGLLIVLNGILITIFIVIMLKLRGNRKYMSNMSKQIAEIDIDDLEFLNTLAECKAELFCRELSVDRWVVALGLLGALQGIVGYIGSKMTGHELGMMFNVCVANNKCVLFYMFGTSLLCLFKWKEIYFSKYKLEVATCVMRKVTYKMGTLLGCCIFINAIVAKALYSLG